MHLYKNICRYLMFYGMFIRNSIITQMEYRFNFFASCFIQLAYMIVKVSYVIVLYGTGVTINGMTPDMMMIFIGTYSALSGVFVSFFLINFGSISQLIRTGELDLLITKPVSLQFMATLRRVDLAFALVSVVSGGAMIVTGWIRAGISGSFLNIAGFIYFTLSGLFLTYSVFLIPNILAFRIVATDGLNQIVSQLWDFNNMPAVIYTNIIRTIGLFIVPVFVITNFGALFIMDRLSPLMILWGLGAPGIFFLICRFLWNHAVKGYSSASS